MSNAVCNVLIIQNYCCNKMHEDEVDGSVVRRPVEMRKMLTKFWGRNVKERDHLQDLGVDGNMLKLRLLKGGVRECWLGTGAIAVPCVISWRQHVDFSPAGVSFTPLPAWLWRCVVLWHFVGTCRLSLQSTWARYVGRYQRSLLTYYLRLEAECSSETSVSSCKIDRYVHLQENLKSQL
jgi:hypothetical protein